MSCLFLKIYTFLKNFIDNERIYCKFLKELTKLNQYLVVDFHHAINYKNPCSKCNLDHCLWKDHSVFITHTYFMHTSPLLLLTDLPGHFLHLIAVTGAAALLRGSPNGQQGQATLSNYFPSVFNTGKM